eukprot:TRINITY_DN38290_c0_g1_i2.p1 TRINITY_DN38290_c0_g1~~TRINITY_DN38290_c0_g1_i2.p1  ORF type:complete len:401 (-),score=87.78 TRINITY_DN38290_c0_g1_i2:192-1289(-)
MTHGQGGQQGNQQGGSADAGAGGGDNKSDEPPAKTLLYTTQSGTEVSLDGTSRYNCIESCKNSPQMKSQGSGLMSLVTGGEQKEINDCVRFCEVEFEMQCFPGNSTVMVRGKGRTALQDVQIGDMVLAVGSCSMGGSTSSFASPWCNGDDEVEDVDMLGDDAQGLHLRYDAVLAWLHRDPEREAEVLELRHACGQVRLTPEHLIFVKRRSGRLAVVFAKDVRTGDQLVCPWVDGGLVYPEVTQVRRVLKKGLYAPLLSCGTLVVDRTVASCYAIPPSLAKTDLAQAVAQLADGAMLQTACRWALNPLCVAAEAASCLEQAAKPFRNSEKGQEEVREGDHHVLGKVEQGVHPYCELLYVLCTRLAA